METGREELKTKGVTVKKHIKVDGIVYEKQPIGPQGGLQEVAVPIKKTIDIELTNRSVEFFDSEGTKINRFDYKGKIKDTQIGNVTKVLVDIGAFQKPKDSRKWIVASKLFQQLNNMKDELETKKVSKPREYDHLEKAAQSLVFTDFLDMANKFNKVQPFFYDRNKVWWLWDFEPCCWDMIDDIDLMNRIDNVIRQPYTVGSKAKGEIIESLKRVGRRNIPKSLGKNIVQYNKKIVDVKTGEISDSTSKVFAVNSIPWDIGESEDTPNMERIFEEWVGKENVQLLYEIVAYCTLPDYPLHRIFCLVGAGRNGKGTFLNMITKFLGPGNVASVDLDVLIANPRFETTKFYKKLMCQMGETNFTVMSKTSLLKRLSGQDYIGFEFKNKNPFDDYNYAKILIATNTLPVTTDKTRGFYSRWIIIKFPTEFNEKKNILDEIPDTEYNNLAKKSITILKKLMESREFTDEGNIDYKIQTYEDQSNPLSKFIDEYCFNDVNSKMPFYEFYDMFATFLLQRCFRTQTKIEVSKQLTEIEGYTIKPAGAKKADGSDTTHKFIFELRLKTEQEKKPVNEMIIGALTDCNEKDGIETGSIAKKIGKTVGDIYPTLVHMKKIGDIFETKNDFWRIP